MLGSAYAHERVFDAINDPEFGVFAHYRVKVDLEMFNNEISRRFVEHDARTPSSCRIIPCDSNAAEFGARRVLAVFAMLIGIAALPILTKAQDVRSAPVTGNEIQVIDLGINASEDETLEAKKAYKQGHIIRVVGGSPADLRRLIGSGAFNLDKVGADAIWQASAVRLGKYGALHQFTSRMSVTSGMSTHAIEAAGKQSEESFDTWREKEVSAELGDPSPPAQAWTQVLSLTDVQSGGWGSTQTVLQVYRLNGTDTSADYYMVLTDPTVSPNFSVPAGNCASLFLFPCGWYTSQRDISMSTNPAGVLFDHGPSTKITTNSGYWSIGFGLPTNVGASFSENWSQDSVTTTDQSNVVAGTAHWSEAFVSESCCSQLPATSTSTFLSHQGAIFKLPPGASFQLAVSVTPTIIYQPSFGNPSQGGGAFFFNAPISPPQFSVIPSAITIPPGVTGNVQLLARIGDNSIGLPWAITNIPSWLNVDQISGARTTVLNLTVQAGTALGTLGTLNFNTDPPFAAPSVASGPLKMNVKVGQPDLQGALLIGGSHLLNSTTNPIDTALLYSADSNQFVAFSKMLQPRAFHTSTLLEDGTILVAGGISGTSQSTALATAELYDPTVGAFSSTSGGAQCPGASGCMITAASNRVATRLTTGKVLITGGLNAQEQCISAAEVYDPATRTFAAAGNMTSVRCYHTATLLPSGEVLVAGGVSDLSVGTLVPTAELYDPTTNSFSPTGNPATPTYLGTAALTSDGVLLMGGLVAGNSVTATAQLYSPASGAFTSIGNMNSPRSGHTSTVLQDGRILIAGGAASQTEVLATAEIYDPATHTFSLLSGNAECPGANGCMIGPRQFHTATLLLNGHVLLSGGVDISGTTALNTTEIFDPSTNTFSAGPTFDGRVSHTSAYLKAPSAIAIQSSANPSQGGQPVTFAAILTVSNPKVLNGTVTFYDGATLLGLSAISNGAAALTAKLEPGQHGITARFGGNDWYGASSSKVLVQQVGTASTSLKLASNPNPSHFGAPVELTAKLKAQGPVAPTGTVNFLDNGTVIGSEPVQGLKAEFTVSNLSAGAHTISAAYSGDANYGPATSNSITQTVNGVTTQTALTSSANPVGLGSPVTFMAKVSSLQGTGTTPTGRVVFADGGSPINSANLVNGVASFTTSSLATGTHLIAAKYSGDSNFSSSASNVLTQTVSNTGGGKVTPIVDLTVNGSTSATVSAGAMVTFAARIHAVSGYPVPTGSITISDSTDADNRYGSAIVTKDPNSNDGLAAITNSGMAAGNYTLVGTYGGDNEGKYYNGAQSNTVSLTVKPTLGGPPPQPSLAIYATAGARNGLMLLVSLTVTNNGTAPASDITLNQIALRTLAGAGKAGLFAPSLPVTVGNLQPGASTVVTLELQVPTTLRKLALTENGTFQDAGGTVYQFSPGQAIFP